MLCTTVLGTRLNFHKNFDLRHCIMWQKSRRPKPLIKDLTDSHWWNPKIRLYTAFQAAFNFNFIQVPAPENRLSVFVVRISRSCIPEVGCKPRSHLGPRADIVVAYREYLPLWILSTPAATSHPSSSDWQDSCYTCSRLCDEQGGLLQRRPDWNR